MKLKGMNRTYLILLIILATVGVLASVGIYYGYQYALQPNIKVAALEVDIPVTDPQTIPWLDMGVVSGQGSFNYHPINTTAEYVMVFSNPSSLSDRLINFTYTTHWPDFLWTFLTLSPGETETVYAHANSGEQLGGDFWVSGGGSDVGFKIIAYACTEEVSFSFSLVNTGGADGYADVVFTVDGASAWAGKYFVPVGNSVPVSGSVTVENCCTHAFDIVVQRQYKP